MSFNLFLRFTGLCAFVAPAPGQMRVVLVNALQGGAHESHCAAIVTPFDNWDPAGRQFAFGFDGTGAGYPSRNMVAILLDGENLSFGFTGAGVTLADIGPQAQCPTQPTDHTAFGWISRMDEVGAGTMNRNALSGLDRSLVLGRLDLSFGTLTTSAFGLNKQKNKILKWQFKDGGASPMGRHRALSEEIQLDHRFTAGTTLTLNSVRFDGQPSRNVVLKEANGIIEAWMVNLPVIDFIVDRGVDPRPPDHHFVHFYRLSTSGGAHVPHPTRPSTGASHCGPPPVVGVTNPKCPPALFSSFQ